VKSHATTVQQYLNELPAERRSAIETVRRVILENLDPTYEEGMQYGMIGYYVPHRVYPHGYHCDSKQPLPFICLASQKNYLSVYLGSVHAHPKGEKWFRDAWAKTGRKLDMGKACLRFRKIEDLALEVIAESIRRVPAKTYIRYYESAVGPERLQRARGTASGGSSRPNSRKPTRPGSSRKRSGRQRA